MADGDSDFMSRNRLATASVFAIGTRMTGDTFCPDCKVSLRICCACPLSTMNCNMNRLISPCRPSSAALLKVMVTSEARCKSEWK